MQHSSTVTEGNSAPHNDIQTAQLAQAVMRRQLDLSIRVALVFLVVVLGLPLMNWLAPDLMAMRIGGFTLGWLILGVLFYPLTWALSGYFIRHSDRIEGELTSELGPLNNTPDKNVTHKS